MIKQLLKITVLIGFSIAGYCASAQSERRWEDIGTAHIYSKQTLKKDGITLVFISKDSLFSKVTQQRLIDAFWMVYPQEVKRFNQKSLHKVTIVVTNEYKGVAATLNGIIKINPAWLKAHPEDIDIITHELMHVVQDYKDDKVAPGWLTEGIADYARYEYGVNNVKSGWTLTGYMSGQQYDNSYRITARFLVWIEKNIRTDIVDQLNNAMRTGIYKPGIWLDLTGKPVDELWKDYVFKPVI